MWLAVFVRWWGLSQGIEAAEASIALDQQLGQRNHLPIPLILLAQIYQCQDQLDESERYYLEACAIAEEAGEPQQLFPCYDGLATLSLARGDTVKAEEYLAKGLEICQKTGYSPDTLIMLPFLCLENGWEREEDKMEQQEQSGVLSVGTFAPNFRLASAQGPDIALEDYRGQRNVLLWLSKGLFCPFCRRYMTQLRFGYRELQERNTEILQVTWSTQPEAQLYFRQYPLSFPYLCDADRAVYPLYGVSIVRVGIGERAAEMAIGMVAMVSDRLFRGEKTAFPWSYETLRFDRYGTTSGLSHR